MTGFTLSEMIRQRARQTNTLHGAFLRNRQQGLLGMQTLIEQQIDHAAQFRSTVPESTPLFTSEQLDAFGFGHYSACFGPRFAKYDGQPIPRIPNGDLKMMSRVLSIEGEPGAVRPPASVTVAYDVPLQPWYTSGEGEIPYGLWMEIALQPCGFLSAYLDSYALVPLGAYFFRNLDGAARLHAQIDARGTTLITTARLLSSVATVGNVIQKYAFSVSANGQPVFNGESSFGYFSPETMANQQGLDGGRQTIPWLRTASPSANAIALPVEPNRLRPFSSVSIVPGGGLYGQGYIACAVPVDPQGWFFPFHFDGDPVMPGSLGVEAVLEMLRVYCTQAQVSSARLADSPSRDQAFRWRYRGQITRQHQMMEMEAHIQAVEANGAQVQIHADGNVWIDGLRIYELKNAAVICERS